MTWLEAYFLIGVAAAFWGPAFLRRMPTFVWASWLYPAAGFVLALVAPQAAQSTRPWVPDLGINLSLALDPLGRFFFLLVTGIGTLIFLYAAAYQKKSLPRLLGFLTLFSVAMLVLVTAQDLVTLFLGWELTSVSSFLLIGFKREDPAAHRAALTALLVTALGALVLLAGISLLWLDNGSFLLKDIHTASPAAIALVAIACFTKSAQVPFHFWLPEAMAAPTPVSAFLHSATMVKAGVFVLARFAPVFGPQPAIVGIGTATLVLGGALALFERDLKRILAWSTVSALGSMTLLAGLATPVAAEALVLTILAHALYKGALFMAAGAVDLHTGSRDSLLLKGVARSAPVLFAVAALAALSMAGIPFFAGFLKKESQLAAVENPILVAAVLLAGVCNVIAAYNVAVRPFLGQPKPEQTESTDDKPKLHPALLVGPAILAILGLAVPFTLTYLETHLGPVVSEVAGQTVDLHLKLFHGITPDLLMSLGAILLGLALVPLWPKTITRLPHRPRLLTFQNAFATLFNRLVNLGHHVVRGFEQSSFRRHLFAYFVTFVALVVYVVAVKPFALDLKFDLLDVPVHEVVLCIFAVVAAFAAILARQRMATVATLGIVGVAVTLTFVTFGAPDLALTQLLVEILTVVLFVLVFSHLPRIQLFGDKAGNIRDAIVALAFGATITVLILGVLSVPKPDKVSKYYVDHAVHEGHGHNVVNVILVDFRGLDTMGEITVLCVAALGAHTLIRFRPVQKRAAKSITQEAT